MSAHVPLPMCSLTSSNVLVTAAFTASPARRRPRVAGASDWWGYSTTTAQDQPVLLTGIIWDTSGDQHRQPRGFYHGQDTVNEVWKILSAAMASPLR